MLIFAGVIVWERCQYNYRFCLARFWIICVAPILFALGRICKLQGSGNVVLAATLVSRWHGFRYGEFRFRDQISANRSICLVIGLLGTS